MGFNRFSDSSASRLKVAPSPQRSAMSVQCRRLSLLSRTPSSRAKFRSRLALHPLPARAARQGVALWACAVVLVDGARDQTQGAMLHSSGSRAVRRCKRVVELLVDPGFRWLLCPADVECGERCPPALVPLPSPDSFRLADRGPRGLSSTGSSRNAACSASRVDSSGGGLGLGHLLKRLGGWRPGVVLLVRGGERGNGWRGAGNHRRRDFLATGGLGGLVRGDSLDAAVGAEADPSVQGPSAVAHSTRGAREAPGLGMDRCPYVGRKGRGTALAAGGLRPRFHRHSPSVIARLWPGKGGGTRGSGGGPAAAAKVGAARADGSAASNRPGRRATPSTVAATCAGPDPVLHVRKGMGSTALSLEPEVILEERGRRRRQPTGGRERRRRVAATDGSRRAGPAAPGGSSRAIPFQRTPG